MGAYNTFFSALLLAFSSLSAALEIGDILAAGDWTGNILVFDGMTLAVKQQIITPCGGYIAAMAFSPDLSLLYAPCTSKDVVYIMNATDPALPIIGSIPSPSVPFSVSTDKSGNLYVVHVGVPPGQLDMFAPNGTLLGQIPNVNTLAAETHGAMHPNQTTMMVTMGTGEYVDFWDIRSKAQTGHVLVSPGAGCNQLQALIDGSIIVACTLCVRWVNSSYTTTSSGGQKLVCGSNAQDNRMYYGVAVDPWGKHFYAQSNNGGALYKFAFADTTTPVLVSTGPFPTAFYELTVYMQQRAPCTASINVNAPFNSVWPSNKCQNTPHGERCIAICNAGYRSNTGPPTATCNLGVWGPVTGSCVQACEAPPSLPLPGGSWPASCTGTPTAQAIFGTNQTYNGTCNGVCDTGFAGSPSIQCVANAWFTTIKGACRAKPMCVGLPTATLLNGVWPELCRDSAVGNCTAQCNPGYSAGSPAIVQCLVDASQPSGARWGTSVTGLCNAEPKGK